MHLKSRVLDELRNGSVYTPGRDAVAVLAANVRSTKNAVRQVIAELVSAGAVELGGGTPRYTNHIALKDRAPFIPASAEGRRQSRYAVDQTGRYYRGTLKPTDPNYRPPSSRTMTEDEWNRVFKGLPYPFGPSDPPCEEQSMSDQAEQVLASAFGDAVTAVVAELGAFEPEATDAGADETAEAASEAADVVEDETDETEEAELTMVTETAADEVTVTQTKVKRKSSRRLTSAHVQRRNLRFERYKELLIDLLSAEPDGMLAVSSVQPLLAEEIGVGNATITDYAGSLAKDGVIKYVRTGWQGPLYIKLLPQPIIPETKRGKTAAALEVLQECIGKPREEYTKLISRRTGYTTATVASLLLTPFSLLGIYRSELVKGERVVTFVQAEPLTEEQYRAISTYGRGGWVGTYPGTQPEILQPGDVQQDEPEMAFGATVEEEPAPVATPVVAAPASPDFTDTLRQLIERSKADRSLIAALQDANETLTTEVERLDGEVTRLSEQRSRQDVQNARYAEVIEHLELMLEVERARVIPEVPAMQLPADLLAEAQALLNG